MGQDTLSYHLPHPQYKSSTSIEETLYRRRSRRKFVPEPLSAEELSQLLWAAYGISESSERTENVHFHLRTAPSAGRCYPLVIYTLVGNVSEMNKGFYKYNAKTHSINRVIQGDLRQVLCEAAYKQKFIKEAAVCIVFTAVYERMTDYYGQRGLERYVCMDLGHAGQNVYLQAEALELGTCAVGAFNDDMVRDALQLPANEIPLYIMPVGKYK